MADDKNQKRDYVQSMDGLYRYVTGFWDKGTCLKSGRINRIGMANMQAWGEDTMFILIKRRAIKKNPWSPDYELYATKDVATCTKEEVDEMMSKVKSRKKKRPHGLFMKPPKEKKPV